MTFAELQSISPWCFCFVVRTIIPWICFFLFRFIAYDTSKRPAEMFCGSFPVVENTIHRRRFSCQIPY